MITQSSFLPFFRFFKVFRDFFRIFWFLSGFRVWFCFTVRTLGFFRILFYFILFYFIFILFYFILFYFHFILFLFYFYFILFLFYFILFYFYFILFYFDGFSFLKGFRVFGGNSGFFGIFYVSF
jgi:hypothetical protein